MSIICSGRTRGRWGRRIALSLTTILASGLAAPVVAQDYRHLDENGVDLVRGDFVMTFEEGSIGKGQAKLALIRRSAEAQFTEWNKLTFDKTGSGSGTEVTIRRSGGVVDRFTGTGLTPAKAEGMSLTKINDAYYEYRSSGGTKITFQNPSGGDSESETSGMCGMYVTGNCDLLPTLVEKPNGETTTLTWDLYPIPDGSGGTWYMRRLATITNSYGYSITFTYLDDTISYGSLPADDWFKASTADFRGASTGSTILGTVSYAYPSSGTVDVTDFGSNTWRITNTSIRRPGEGSASFSVNSTTAVTSATRDGITTSYSRSVVGSTATMTVTNPLSQSTVIVSNLTKGRPTSITDGNGKTTSYTYDGSNRLTRITYPEGNYVNYTLDARGNVTETRMVAKSGSGLSDIVTTASFDSTCTYIYKCNQPNSVTDARGNTTDYTYASHGAIATVTQPAPSGSGTRPQTRYSYTLTNGELQLTGISACQTGAAPGCVGTSDEVKTTLGYDAYGNLNSVTRAAGDNSLSATTTATYDDKGQLLTVDGPLSGSDDTTTYRYDAAGRQVGVISADPDGGGALKRRAVKTTYDIIGRVTDVETGNVNGTSNSDWSAFAAAQKVTTTWSGAYKTKEVLSASSTNYQVTQYSYDAAGRLECVAQRMNSATWGSLPGSACTLGTAGSFGDDRIVKTTYDAAGQATKATSGYGTGIAADDATGIYTDNGKVATLVDAMGNKTSYTYDGFDRLSKTSYPNTTQGAGTSSSTDYQELVYDAGSNITSVRLRGYSADSSKHIDFTYDTLNRPTAKDLPSSEPDVAYSYDLLGRLTGASQTGNALTFGYDALGRNTSQGGPNGTVSYQYDAAGRRTRLTWPDSFYVTYDYLVTGEMTHIRENGAGSGLGVLATYAYDDLGRRTTLTRGNGTVSTWSYDNISRLSSLALDLASTANDVTNSYSYSPAGQITSFTRSNDSYAWTGAANVNRSYTTNGLNQHTLSGAVSLGYDARGNLTSSGSDSYGYSSENLLTSGPGVTLAYDPLLRLAAITTSTYTHKWQYDGADLIAEYSSAGTLLQRYVHGPGTDEPLNHYVVGASARYWLHADERGSIVRGSNDSGASIASLRYDEYGLPQFSTPPRFAYTGQTWIAELGMYNYKARIYSPTLGRFMQADPIGYGDGMNLYAYVGGDPVNRSDPDGNCKRYVGYILSWWEYSDGSKSDPEIENVWEDYPCGDEPGLGTSNFGGGGGGGDQDYAAQQGYVIYRGQKIKIPPPPPPRRPMTTEELEKDPMYRCLHGMAENAENGSNGNLKDVGDRAASRSANHAADTIRMAGNLMKGTAYGPLMDVASGCTEGPSRF